ncbi:MAG TPA: hypothetical protein VIU64_09055 [Polyangia bacterium]
MSFVSQRLALARVPLNGPKGEEWHTVLGGAQDAEMQVLRVAGIARSVTRAPDDALDDIGSLYALPRAPREAAAAFGGDSSAASTVYRARLAGAWSFWGQAPLASGFASTLGVYSSSAAQVYSGLEAGFPSPYEVAIVCPNKDGAMAMPDTGWDQQDADGNDVFWDDGGVWDLASDHSKVGTIEVVDVDWIRRMLRAQKGAQAYPVLLAIALGVDSHGATALWDDGTAWDDGGTWDDPSVAGLFTVIPLGHVWGEESIYGGGPGVYDDGGTWDDGVVDGLAAPSGGW